MGFVKELGELDDMRRAGASDDDVANAFPTALLKAVGYYGTPGGAASEFKRIAEGLDIAMVRVVAARPNIESVRAVMEACRPS